MVMPASRTTLPHFCTSLRTKAAKASGGMPPASAPSLNQSSRVSASSKALSTSACRRCTTAGGVPAGTHSPYHEVTSKPGRPDSAAVGISGNDGERLLEVTAIARSLPLRMCGAALLGGEIDYIFEALGSAVVAGPVPLYGTCTALMPAALLNISQARCRVVPLPAEPQLILPGLALA
jgi:hypothetical protein